MAEPLLPELFADLEHYLDWAVEPERARTERKAAATMDEIRAFYDAVMARIDEILDYLDGCSRADMPAPAHRLYLLSLSLIEVATLVEIYGRREAVEACDPLRFVPEH